uniref:DUF938 domain-containing protein n=1 Tax=Kwoniella bestiolae CBS 10118 TaxID=1296100 RepID=A0A1B9GDL1_9TREE|nr:hypothetical protein I302_00605 [Kwoniella bestiolae CBS 10118]OCF29111.1 hypothetical protein I302_00605 [Kwoniella bestiolae CBS 10118]
MSYPSIITQPGAAQRNVQPIIDELSKLIEPNTKSQILEFGSGDYTHLQAFARRWEKVQWWGTVRDEAEQGSASSRLLDHHVLLPNLNGPRVLDIEIQDDWIPFCTAVKFGTAGPFTGFIMNAPENIFKHISPINPSITPRTIDVNNGWVAAYGPWLNDNGSYKSEADEKFDKEYIKSKSPLLGLRTIKSISEIALKWGFVEESRKELPKGNVFVVWRVKGGQ